MEKNIENCIELKKYISTYYNSNIYRFSISYNVSTQTTCEWIKSGAYILDGKVVIPRKHLVINPRSDD